MSMQAWRSQIGYVSQESSMMAGTIRANLTYGLENASAIKDAKLWEVAKMSYADQFISEFSNGLDTEVGERGVKLRSEEHTSELQSRGHLVCPLLLEKKTFHRTI